MTDAHRPDTPPGSTEDRLARAREALRAAEAEAGGDGPVVAEAAPSDGGAATARATREADAPEQAPGEREPDPHQVAKAIVLRQLTMAPRSRKQLEDKLCQKGCDDDVARSVLDRLTEVGLVDDEAFARTLVRSRQETKGLAARALGQELRRKGIDDALIDDALRDVDPEDERARARDLVTKRVRSLSGLERQVQTRRLAGFLARKGYHSGVAFQVISEVLDDLPEHRRD